MYKLIGSSCTCCLIKEILVLFVQHTGMEANAVPDPVGSILRLSMQSAGDNLVRDL